MTKREAEQTIKAVREVVSDEISGNASTGGHYAAALASEGYAGGYRDALDDVLLLLQGVTPRRRHYWEARP